MKYSLIGGKLEDFIDSSLENLEGILKMNYKKHNNKYLNKTLASYLIRLFIKESAGTYVYRKKEEESNKDYKITSVFIKLLTKVAQNAYEAGIISELINEEDELLFLENLYWGNIFGTRFKDEHNNSKMTSHFYLHAGEVARKLFNKTGKTTWFERSLESLINYLKLSIKDDSEYETRRIILENLSNMTFSFYELNKKENVNYAYGPLFFNLIQLSYELPETKNYDNITRKLSKLYTFLNQKQEIKKELISNHELDLLILLLPNVKEIITPELFDYAKKDLKKALKQLIEKI